jgi:hypothetical protein
MSRRQACFVAASQELAAVENETKELVIHAAEMRAARILSGCSGDVRKRRVMAVQKSFKMIPLAEITILPEIQIRIRLDEGHVGDIKDAIDEGVDIDPIDLFVDDQDRKILGDGMHRYTAFVNSKRDKIPAMVHDDNPKDAVSEAIEFSLRRNCHHGLRMTPDDKRRAVWVALSDKIIRRKGDKPIAELCGVSAGLVKKIRADNVDPTAQPKKKKVAKKKAPKSVVSRASTPEPEEPSPLMERVNALKDWIKGGYMDWPTVAELFETPNHTPILWPKTGAAVSFVKDGKKTTVEVKQIRIARKAGEYYFEFEVGNTVPAASGSAA